MHMVVDVSLTDDGYMDETGQTRMQLLSSSSVIVSSISVKHISAR